MQFKIITKHAGCPNYFFIDGKKVTQEDYEFNTIRCTQKDMNYNSSSTRQLEDTSWEHICHYN